MEWLKISILAVCLLFIGDMQAYAQTSQAPGHQYIVSLYRVAPGKHLEFLKWQAQREAVDKEAGAPAIQWYRHTNGDSWDFIAINEVSDPEQQAAQDKEVDEVAKRKGLTTGFAASLEFRQFISYHTDTYATGPFSAQELVDQASAP